MVNTNKSLRERNGQLALENEKLKNSESAIHKLLEDHINSSAYIYRKGLIESLELIKVTCEKGSSDEEYAKALGIVFSIAEQSLKINQP